MAVNASRFNDWYLHLRREIFHLHLEASFTEAAPHPTWGWGEARVFSFFKHPHPPFIPRPLTSHRNVASLRSDWDSAVMKRHHLQREQRFLHFFHLLCAPFLSSAFLLESLHDFTSADEHVHIHMFLITACPDVFNSSSLHASVSPRSKPYSPPPTRELELDQGGLFCCATELTM